MICGLRWLVWEGDFRLEQVHHGCEMADLRPFWQGLEPFWKDLRWGGDRKWRTNCSVYNPRSLAARGLGGFCPKRVNEWNKEKQTCDTDGWAGGSNPHPHPSHFLTDRLNDRRTNSWLDQASHRVAWPQLKTERGREKERISETRKEIDKEME